MVIIEVTGYDDLIEVINNLDEEDIYVYFTSTKVRGYFWCPACQVAIFLKSVTMVVYNVAGFEALNDQVKQLNQHNLFVYFTGEKENGINWCSDCENAQSPFNSFADKHKDLTIIICVVGTRSVWKNSQNEFRKVLKINEIPTFMDWNNKEKKITGFQCANENLLEMILE